MMIVDTMKTYIIKTASNEYYCGRTLNIAKRLNHHRKEIYPNWFSFPNRKVWSDIFVFDGDVEMKIKSFGVKRFIETIESLDKRYPLS